MTEIVSEYSIDESKFTRVDTLDVEPILTDNAKERASGENEQSGKVARKFASVDVVTLEKLRTEHGIAWWLFGQDPDVTAWMVRWFNDRDNRKFRTSEVNLGSANRFVQ